MSEERAPYNWYCYCSICKARKPDNEIKVLSQDFDIGLGVYYAMTRNINYCADNNECFEQAKSLMKNEINHYSTFRNSNIVFYPVTKIQHENSLRQPKRF